MDEPRRGEEKIRILETRPGNISAVIGRTGYMTISRRWRKGDRLSLSLDMTPKIVAADPRVKADEGRRAIQMGPVVYCLEETDNPGIADAVLEADAILEPVFEPSLLGGVCTVTAHQNGGDLKFIPYYAWDNREPGRMQVWVKFAEADR